MKTGSQISEAREARADYAARNHAFKNVEKAFHRSKKKLTTSAFDSERMGRIRQKGTKPELVVRQIVAALGHRYRTKNKDLPGSPDLANRSKRWAIIRARLLLALSPGMSKGDGAEEQPRVLGGEV